MTGHTYDEVLSAAYWLCLRTARRVAQCCCQPKPQYNSSPVPVQGPPGRLIKPNSPEFQQENGPRLPKLANGVSAARRARLSLRRPMRVVSSCAPGTGQQLPNGFGRVKGLRPLGNLGLGSRSVHRRETGDTSESRPLTPSEHYSARRHTPVRRTCSGTTQRKSGGGPARRG